MKTRLCPRMRDEGLIGFTSDLIRLFISTRFLPWQSVHGLHKRWLVGPNGMSMNIA